MEKKQACSHMQKRKKKNKDLCPVCDENLYYNNDMTQRVGLLAEDDFTIEGWMCPFCKSQFDLKDNLVNMSDYSTNIGRA